METWIKKHRKTKRKRKKMEIEKKPTQTWITNEYIYMGADVHAFGVNNLIWTVDSRKIGYCPKELKKKIQQAQAIFYCSERKKNEDKSARDRNTFTKALSESFASIWIVQNTAKYALSIDKKKEERMTVYKQTNKHKCNIETRWRMLNMLLYLYFDVNRRWLLQKQKQHQQQQQQ